MVKLNRQLNPQFAISQPSNTGGEAIQHRQAGQHCFVELCRPLHSYISLVTGTKYEEGTLSRACEHYTAFLTSPLGPF